MLQSHHPPQQLTVEPLHLMKVPTIGLQGDILTMDHVINHHHQVTKLTLDVLKVILMVADKVLETVASKSMLGWHMGLNCLHLLVD